MVASLVSPLSLTSCHFCSRLQQERQTLPFQLWRSDSQKLLITKHMQLALRTPYSASSSISFAPGWWSSNRPQYPQHPQHPSQISSLSSCKCLPYVSAWATPQEVFQQVQGDEGSSTSASAIAAAINSVAASSIKFLQRSERETRGLFSGPSKDFLELCQQQLAICDTLFGHKAKLTIYIRPVESYGTPDLELRQVAGYPKWTLGKDDASLVIVGNYGNANVLRSAESALLSKEFVELPDFNALVLPMVKDPFLVGILVAEWVAAEVESVSKGNKLRAVRPRWPPHKGTLRIQQHVQEGEFGERNNDTHVQLSPPSLFTTEQKFEGMRIARSLAIACVMDQRTLLLQQSSWQRGVRVGDFLEQIRGPLAAVRTLGRMLQPQMKKGEISTDILEDILVQGEQMKDVVQQFQKVVYLNENPSNMLQYNESGSDDSGALKDGSSTRTLEDKGLAVRDDKALRHEQIPLRSMISVGHSRKKDQEAPMPPVALAPLMHSGTESCNVSNILIDLVNSGAVLARQKGQAVELKQSPASAPYYAAIDEYSLRQALSNLLDSSLQHILPGGWVKVEVMHAPGGGVLVTIEDNGPDFSLLSQAQALAPLGSGLKFGGRHSTDTPFILNVGAELSIAQDILEEFGCILRVTSPYLPKTSNGMGGTRLELWLPSPPSKDEPS